MRLTAKILSWLLASVAVVMILFTSLAIYMLKKNLEEEAYRSHKLIYTLFLPTVSRYLWEFDLTGIKETLSNIIENNYANKIYIYDSDAGIVTSLYKDPVTGKISNIKDSDKNDNSDKIITKEYKDLIVSKANTEDFFIYEENTTNDTSRLIGPMQHKKGSVSNPSIIGYFVLDYSTDNITTAIRSMIRGVIILSFCITIMLVLSIGVLLRKSLINNIIKLSQASINITKGLFTKIQESKGSRDEMSDLVKNFNAMIGQIEANQENLKILAEEGIKISSKFNISDIAIQVSESLNKIAKINLNTEFYVINTLLSSNQSEGYHEMLKPGFRSVIKLSHSMNDPTNKKRFSIKDGKGKSSIIIQIDDLRIAHSFSYTAAESVYNSILALQISISNALDNIRFVTEQKEQQRLISEQETARLVQNNLMPKFEHRNVGKFEIVNHFEAATECAGDWWNYYSLPNEKLLLLLGDVTGHGTASALLTAVVKGYCDSIHIQQSITAKEILQQLDSVVRESGDGNKVMTMFAAVLDPQHGIIEFSNAAHNFPMIIKRKNNAKTVEKLIAQGRPLGFEQQSNNSDKPSVYLYDQKQMKLEEGDILFIYSDGLVEAVNGNNEEFSEKRLKKLLQNQSENNDLSSIKNELIKEFRLFIQNKRPDDDMTFLICKFTKP
ncbi:MAG: HAMP domain-containing protein [Spirobacillus cienkowskii]|jgi:sigma-B regulation protein RsbU (phosphoserine phosphatase)|uniref:HAMP domain-containing protein n=1 Tax=Spirobacillus cienkowskii TaxID=495820 RepID=A0A369KR51_9BACT|nr:MAG: HAMP domain-containing protein [Spirobacillus cienkowskii]